MRTIYTSTHAEYVSWCQRCDAAGMRLSLAVGFDFPFDATLVGFPFDVARHLGFVRYTSDDSESINVVQSRQFDLQGGRVVPQSPPGAERIAPRLSVAARSFRVAAESLELLACESPSTWPLAEVTKTIDALAAAAYAGNQLMLELSATEIGRRLEQKEAERADSTVPSH